MKKNFEIERLKTTYAQVCNDYLKKFCANYELPYEEDAWVAQDPGTIAAVADYHVSIDTIRYCVDNDLKDTHELLSWYDYCTEVYSLVDDELPLPNFKSWHKGCPRLSEKALREIRECQISDIIENAKREIC